MAVRSRSFGRPVLLLALLLAALPAGAQTLLPVEPAEPGGLARLVVTGAPPEALILAQLIDQSEKVVLSGRGFHWPGTPAQVVLLGIPSTLAAGFYRLNLSLGGTERPLLLESTLKVSARKFLREEIALDQAMSDLREKPDPRKTEEALELYRLLATFRPQGIRHTGSLAKPVDSERRTSFFGDRRSYHYSDGGTSASIHAGIDYAAPVGAPVRSAGAGLVVLTGFKLLTGNTVVLEHLPGVFSLYFHMNAISVKQGEQVEAGRLIGVVGATGLATGPHLHWELRVQGTAVDPEAFFGRPILDKSSILGIMESDYAKGR